MGASRWPESKPLWPSPLVDPSGFSSCSLPAHSLNSTIGTHLLVVFYLLSPIPTFIAKRYADDSLSSNPCRELAWFLTTGIVVSAFALPIVWPELLYLEMLLRLRYLLVPPPAPAHLLSPHHHLTSR